MLKQINKIYNKRTKPDMSQMPKNIVARFLNRIIRITPMEFRKGKITRKVYINIDLQIIILLCVSRHLSIHLWVHEAESLCV